MPTIVTHAAFLPSRNRRKKSYSFVHREAQKDATDRRHMSSARKKHWVAQKEHGRRQVVAVQLQRVPSTGHMR